MKLRISGETAVFIVVVILAVSFTGAAIADTITAITQKETKLPWVTTLTFISTNLKVEEVEFEYELETYSEAKITAKNYGGSAESGTLSVVLMDSGGNLIAGGQTAITNLGAGITDVFTVTLTWMPGKTIMDLVDGSVIIEGE